MNLIDRITFNPRQCGGRPCIRGMRIRVIDVLDLLLSGLTPAQIVDQLPDLELDDVRAAITCAQHKLNHPTPPGKVTIEERGGLSVGILHHPISEAALSKALDEFP